MHIFNMKDRLEKEGRSKLNYKELLVKIDNWRTIEELTDVIWSLDSNLRFTYVSPSVEKILGYSQEEILEKSLDQLVTSESLSLFQKTLADAITHNVNDSLLKLQDSIKAELKHRNGTTIWLEISSVFMRDENNTPIGILGFARNISDQVRTVLALKESESKYLALVEQSVLGIVIAQGNPIRLVYVNESIEKMLGYRKDDMVQWKEAEIYKLVHPDDRDSFFRRFLDRLENKATPDVYEFRAVRKDGEIVWFEVHGSRIEYQAETSVLAIFIDITERRIAQIEAEYARIFTEFLIDLMSHDLNNIHQGMMTSLELMSLHEELPPRSKILLENTLSQLDRARGLISRVKKLSDVKSKSMTMARIDIHDPISKAIESIKNTFPYRRIIVNSSIIPGKYIVKGDLFLLDVFYNLFHNAVKFDINESVILDIDAGYSPDGDSLQLIVTDRGGGIPDSKKSSILDRLGEEKRSLSGIGLTLVKHIIEQYQGEIWIEDRISGDYSKGTKFVILLPLFQE